MYKYLNKMYLVIHLFLGSILNHALHIMVVHLDIMSTLHITSK